MIGSVSKRVLFSEGVTHLTAGLQCKNDIIIVDIDSYTIAEAKKEYPNHLIVAITDRGVTQPHEVFAVLAQGAIAMLMRPSKAVLLRTLELVDIGGKGVIPSIGYQFNPWKERTREPSRLDIFSKEELRIIALVAKGLTNKAIAQSLGKALATVKVQTKSIFHKLKVRNRTQVAMWYLEEANERLTGYGIQDGVIGPS